MELTEKEIKEGNILIVDFLEWEWHSNVDDETIWIPNMYPFTDVESTGQTTYNIMECEFHDNWNWIHSLWEELHRKVCIPMVRDNKHLRYLRPLIQETKKAIIWGHKETTYKNMIKLIELYNKQFFNE